jgi:hypothetical protein
LYSGFLYRFWVCTGLYDGGSCRCSNRQKSRHKDEEGKREREREREKNVRPWSMDFKSVIPIPHVFIRFSQVSPPPIAVYSHLFGIW